MKLTLMTATILMSLFWANFQTSAGEPHTDLPKALAEAKAHHKPVFIYVYDSI
ncbi:MAG: hypothetical protein H8E27_12800 [Verrucomicrobia subdivision 3 bacterium]|nr:hypothetical protein [Limisphaerales bacterium]